MTRLTLRVGWWQKGEQSEDFFPLLEPGLHPGGEGREGGWGDFWRLLGWAGLGKEGLRQELQGGLPFLRGAGDEVGETGRPGLHRPSVPATLP